MKSVVVAFLSGLVFAIGLAVSGMTQPTKVIGFLDFFGRWDPSLVCVMGGAIGVYLPLFRLIRGREKSFLGLEMRIPSRTDIDARLIGGSILFGVGWGLGGFCPGPGFVAAGSRMTEALVFMAAMIAGMVVFRLYERFKTPVESFDSEAPVPR